MSRWLVAYDVRDARRLKRLHREMTAWGLPIEYSVFLLSGTEDRCRACLKALCALLDPKRDDHRCFRLPTGFARVHLGRKSLPEGVFCPALGNMN